MLLGGNAAIRDIVYKYSGCRDIVLKWGGGSIEMNLCVCKKFNWKREIQEKWGEWSERDRDAKILEKDSNNFIYTNLILFASNILTLFYV